MKVENRTFIISGGSSGLGLATAEDLHEAGAYVVILDLQPLSGSTSFLHSSKRVKFIKVDITKTTELELAVEQTALWASKVGAPLGGVLNCAGIGLPSRILDEQSNPHPLDLWDLTIAVNLTGSFNLSRLVVQHLAKVSPDDKGERGMVIFVASLSAFEGSGEQAAYAASKGGLVSMTLPMARDLGRLGIRVNTIAPGGFTTPLTTAMPPKFSEALSRMAIFPQRMGEPNEFSQTVRWLIECGYMNGECIKLWGGTRYSSARL